MYIADNVIKHHLKGVYFIVGSACAGKTTATKYLAEKYDLFLFNWDDHHERYRTIANPIEQPSLYRQFTSWEDYFMRPPEEYAKALRANLVEQTDMALTDLLMLSGKYPRIIVDGFFSAQVLKQISDYQRVYFLLASDEALRRDNFAREDKRDMFECIMSLSNPERAKENVFSTLAYLRDMEESEVIESRFNYNIRQVDSDPLLLIQKIEKHFGLVQPT